MPSPAPSGSALRLVGVLSSHIGDRQRLARLAACLDSVIQQEQALAAFFIVWSAREDLVADVQTELERFQAAVAPVPVHTLRQMRRTSQFYDLRWLHDELLQQEPLGTWLLFTDDDDLWAPCRVGSYLRMMDEYARRAGVTAICAAHKVRPTHRNLVASSAHEVNDHLKSGAAQHCGGVRSQEEFFDFACPREAFGSFLGLCNEETLLHPFADLRLTRFLSEYYTGGKVMYFPSDGKNPQTPWVYYYSTAYRDPSDEEAFEQFAAQGQASTVVRVTAQDREEAIAAYREVGCGGEPSDSDLQEFVEFVSGLRQNIDGMLIRHFPDEPMSVGEMKRIAVGQCPGQGEPFALRLAERLARQSCARFGITLA